MKATSNSIYINATTYLPFCIFSLLFSEEFKTSFSYNTLFPSSKKICRLRTISVYLVSTYIPKFFKCVCMTKIYIFFLLHNNHFTLSNNMELGKLDNISFILCNRK